MIELEDYTYQHYLALYDASDGQTHHFLSTAGYHTYILEKLSKKEFSKDKANLMKILSHDDDWLIKNHPDDYIDYAEKEMWEQVMLKQKLFVIELERFNKIKEAMEGVE